MRDEITNILRELLTVQKTEVNSLIAQHLRQQQEQQQQQQQLVTSKVQTATPLPAVSSPNLTATTLTSDIQQQTALKLVHSNQLNQAFEYVLSASDLNLVLYLCENVRPAELFSIQPCPLKIPVILSLIQQLAADLNTHQELKYK